MEYVEVELMKNRLMYLSNTLVMLAIGFSITDGSKDAEGVCCVLETYVSAVLKEIDEHKNYSESLKAKKL